MIKEPIDMKLLAQRAKNKYYATQGEFIRDVNKMFDNCRIYNTETSEYYKLADDLQAYFQMLLSST